MTPHETALADRLRAFEDALAVLMGTWNQIVDYMMAHDITSHRQVPEVADRLERALETVNAMGGVGPNPHKN